MTITPTAAKVSLLATDWANSVTRRVAEAGTSAFGYAAFGQRSPTVDSDTGPGFNGQYLERTGTYLLGNGYRGYAPTLRRFNSPDSFSPFGDGGLNSYVYCKGEPVNRRDPSGHLSDSAQVGLLIGAGFILAVLGGGAAYYSRTARVAGAIAAGTGVTTAVVGTTSLFATARAPAFENSKSELKYIALGILLLGLGLTAGAAGGARWLSKGTATKTAKTDRVPGFINNEITFSPINPTDAVQTTNPLFKRAFLSRTASGTSLGQDQSRNTALDRIFGSSQLPSRTGSITSSGSITPAQLADLQRRLASMRGS